VERAVLRCTAKTFVTFRDHDSVGSGIRLETWNELAIDDYLFVDGHVKWLAQASVAGGHTPSDIRFSVTQFGGSWARTKLKPSPPPRPRSALFF